MNNWSERTEILLGEEGLLKLKNSTVFVVGLGGVGAYAAEMICRAGVGRMIIMDSDTVNISNKNRQLVALDSTIGELKTSVMEKRLKDINPDIDLYVIDKYLEEDNIVEIFNNMPHEIDFVVDAIDTLAPKLALIKHCVFNGVKHISSMGAGAKLDATKIRITDISKSYNCPLAYIIRKKLRKDKIYKGFNVVFSEELPDRAAILPVDNERNKKSQVGTISYLPAVFGCICAQGAIEFLLAKS